VGVVEDDVDPAVPIKHLGGETVQIVFKGEIGRVSANAGTACPQFAGESLQPVLGPGADCERRARRRLCRSDRGANARPHAGNQRHLTVEGEDTQTVTHQHLRKTIRYVFVANLLSIVIICSDGTVRIMSS
jgi:hypothetical protein